VGPSPRAEERYYIVVPSPQPPLSWVVTGLMAMAVAALLGQQPERDGTPLTSLMPVEPAWTTTLEATPQFPAVHDQERIYLALANDSLVALSRVNGRVAWTQPMTSTAPPSIAAGAVYVLTGTAIHALDAMSGTEQWQTPADQHLSLSLTRVGDTLYGIAIPATLVARRAADGSVAWQSPLPAAPAHAVVGDSQAVYAALADGTVVAVSVADGHLIWQRRLTGSLTRLALVGDRLVVGSSENDVFALDTSQGAVSWRWRVGADVIGASGDEKTVFIVALDNLVRAVSRSTGNQRWKRPISSRPAHPPEVFGDLVVVTSVSPTVSAYSAVTGQPAGTYVAPAELAGAVLLMASTAPSDVVMVVVTRDGRVVGLRPKPPAPAALKTEPPGSERPADPVPADGATPTPAPQPPPESPSPGA
jgi:outer membrane protein assembly factor BamB